MNTAAVRRPTLRAYRQTARAEASAATHRAIGRAFVGLLRERWFEDVKLEEVAAAAGVTVQTVIRRYGGKGGLLEDLARSLSSDVRARRAAPAGDVRAALRALVRDYDTIGDLIVRLLAQEDRQAALRPLLAQGRAEHAAWVAEVFAAALRGLRPAAREHRLDALVAVTDVYTWKILRRDRGRSAAAVADVMNDLAIAVASSQGSQR